MNICRAFQKRVTLLAPSVLMTSTCITRPFSALKSQAQSSILIPSRSTFVMSQFAGLKHVAHPHRRCSHCYMVIEDERTWVFCDKFPRHKQVTKLQPRVAKNKMIMTHATQGSKKSRNKSPRGGMHMLTQAGFRMDF